MQIIILTGRGLHASLGVRMLATLGAAALVALAVAFWAGARLALSSAPLARADAHHDYAVSVLGLRHELDDALHRTGAELDALTRRLAQLQARVDQADLMAAQAALSAGLGRGELDFRQAVAAPRLALTPGLPAALEHLRVRLDDRLAKLAALGSVLATRRVHVRSAPAGWPVGKGWISSTFGPRTDPVSGRAAYHDGLDFAGRYKSPVLAVADGVVSVSGHRPGYGNLVQVAHGRGLVTRYAHNQKNLVRAGDTVRRGDVIALMGSTGRSTGAHVHFEVRHEGNAVDPRPFVAAREDRRQY